MKKTILLLLIIPLLSFSIHKYYISLTEIEFREESKTVQIIMTLFIDDIEKAINQEYNIDAQISTKKEIENIDNFLTKYINTNFKININKTIKNYNYIGKEYDGNTLYLYFEIENIPFIKNLEIENTLMFTSFKEQQNIIKIKNNNKTESLFLTQKKSKSLLIF